MHRRLQQTGLRRRAVVCCALLLHLTTALLGSGGLHALTPHCCHDSVACNVSAAPGTDSPDKSESLCSGHSHGQAAHSHSHAHGACGHAAPGDATEPEGPAPVPHHHHDDCSICQHFAAPGVVAPVIAPELTVDCLVNVASLPDCLPVSRAVSSPPIRGPPTHV
ncbi:MAG: hypothetical protein KF774_02125 [Planctomyces sp.]|nr:hypothetical protein [Planctomyces sp.]